MMTYPGNNSLSSELQQRILSTFEQTVGLAREGSRQEALLGCDFVLRMDPQFEPARVLQERLRSGTGAVPVDDLSGNGSAPPPIPTPMPAMDDPFSDLDGLSIDLPDLPGSGSDLRAEFETLLRERRFQELMAAAVRESGAVAADGELQRLATAGQERMEAEPYVLKFLTSARQALQAGQMDEVGRLLDKARSLDSSHPEIAELDRARSAGPAIELPSPLQASAMPAGLVFGGGGGGDSESDRRIRELLDEGQSALDSGDPQGAIDAWSRIFLIDIDHQEAARRIEGARRIKAENERQVEEIFHEGLAKLEAGDPAAARQAFQRVLDLQPGYFAAREYLTQLDAGTVPTPRPAVAPGLAGVTSEPALALPSDLEIAGGDLKEEILVPPDPSEVPARAATPRRPSKVAVKPEGRARKLFLLVGSVVLVAALVGAWLAYQNWDSLFPNSQAEDGSGIPDGLPPDTVARAVALHRAGKTAPALAQLRRVLPSDPQYQQAQKLIAEWEKRTAPAPAPTDPAAVAETAPAPVDPRVEQRQRILATARQAHGERSYLRTFKHLQQANALGKLEGEDLQLLEDTKRKLAPLAKQIDLFRQQEWEYVLPELWRMREADPSDRDVHQLIVDSYYNLAVRDLQRADAMKAAEKFKEALALEPNDPDLRRHFLFAQTYQERPKDLLYRIYVKYLPFR